MPGLIYFGVWLPENYRDATLHMKPSIAEQIATAKAGLNALKSGKGIRIGNSYPISDEDAAEQIAALEKVIRELEDSAEKISTADIHPNFFKIEKAWWNWVNKNCLFTTARARGRWMSANTFEYEGTTWTRDYLPLKSNSGKNVVDSSIIFHGADGRTIHKNSGSPNRRNDSERNWGLGRE
jgi:hypothetical protein